MPIVRLRQPSACLTSTATRSLLFVEKGRLPYCESKCRCRAQIVVAPGGVLLDRLQNRHRAKFLIFA